MPFLTSASPHLSRIMVGAVFFGLVLLVVAGTLGHSR